MGGAVDPRVGTVGIVEEGFGRGRGLVDIGNSSKNPLPLLLDGFGGDLTAAVGAPPDPVEPLEFGGDRAGGWGG